MAAHRLRDSLDAVFQPLRQAVVRAVVGGFRLLPGRIRRVLLAWGSEGIGLRSVEVDGSLGTFAGTPDDGGVFRAYLAGGDWAPELQEVQARVFAGGQGTYLDIGANIGLTVVPAARRGARCHAFEMEERNLAFLRRNTEANGVSAQVTIHGGALYSEDTVLEMELSDENRGDHRLRVEAGLPADAYGESRRATRKVQARRLDSVLRREDLVAPVLAKIDVQGAEVDVLRGAGALLDAIDFLVLEFWPYGLAKLGRSPEELFALLDGFRLGAVLAPSKPLGRLSPVADLVAAAGRIPADGSSTLHLDLFLARRELD